MDVSSSCLQLHSLLALHASPLASCNKRWIRGIRVYGYICVSCALCVSHSLGCDWGFSPFSLVLSPVFVTTGSPGDRIGPEASRLRLSHWAGPSVTGSAGWSQKWYGGIIVDILAKESKFP